MTMQHITIDHGAERFDRGHGEMVVAPSFYLLDVGIMADLWDGALIYARARNLFTISAIWPEACVEDVMHTDEAGVEHFYLLDPVMLLPVGA